VQITYDVETLGATVKQEIPFVVGVMGDFTGSTTPAAKLADRRFVEIDRDNFDKVMGSLQATLAIAGDDKKLPAVTKADGVYRVDAAAGTAVSGTLQISTLADFSPPRIREQLAAPNDAVKQMRENRQLLSELLVKLQADDGLSASLSSPAMLDQAWTALAAAGAQVDKTAAALAMFASPAPAKGFDTAKFGDDKAVIEALLAVANAAVGVAPKGFKGALATASTANEARVAAPTDTQKQKDAAAAFSRASDALSRVYHATDDATSVISAAAQSLEVGEAAPKVPQADRDLAVGLAAAAAAARDALAPMVRKAGSLCSGAAARYLVA
jgi:type VI secretion system protein ImpB